MNKSWTNIVDITENSLDFSCMTLGSSSNYSLLMILCFRQGSICVLCPSPKMNILNIYFQTNTRQRMSANNNMKRKMHLSLLGNIGCGKSSVLNKIKGYRDMNQWISGKILVDKICWKCTTMIQRNGPLSFKHKFCLHLGKTILIYRKAAAKLCQNQLTWYY